MNTIKRFFADSLVILCSQEGTYYVVRFYMLLFLSLLVVSSRLWSTSLLGIKITLRCFEVSDRNLSRKQWSSWKTAVLQCAEFAFSFLETPRITLASSRRFFRSRPPIDAASLEYIHPEAHSSHSLLASVHRQCFANRWTTVTLTRKRPP